MPTWTSKFRSFLTSVKNILTAPIVEPIKDEDFAVSFSEMLNAPPPLIYLAHPYIRSPEENYNMAAKYAAERVLQGEFIIAPVLMYHPIKKKHSLPSDTEWWLRYDFQLLAACDELRVLMLPGWQQSVGVKNEIAMAKSLGKPITYAKFE